MQHCLALREWTPDKIGDIVSRARALKADKAGDLSRILRNRVLSMVFFNPSLRTRTTFEVGMLRLGGNAVTLNVGGDTWKLEHRDGAVMDGDAAEHIREAAPVLSRYCDVLGVRTFARMKDAAEDAADGLLRSFARFATVPVISLESAIEHPCQGLADRLTIEERFASGSGQRSDSSATGKRFVLSWAPHIKPLPLAVSHSAVLAAASAGMNVTIAHPRGYELNSDVLDTARKWCGAAGARLEVTNEQRAATRAADVFYVKSWGSPALYGDAARQSADFATYRDWMVTAGHLGPHTLLMHCLPTRRNVELADSALDDPRSIVVDQAENRMWAQMALLEALLAPSA